MLGCFPPSVASSSSCTREARHLCLNIPTFNTTVTQWNKWASTQHRRNVCLRHCRLILLVMTLTSDPLTVKTFSAVPTHVINIGKFHWTPFTEQKTSRCAKWVLTEDGRTDGWTDVRPENIMVSLSTVVGAGMKKQMTSYRLREWCCMLRFLLAGFTKSSGNEIIMQSTVFLCRDCGFSVSNQKGHSVENQFRSSFHSEKPAAEESGQRLQHTGQFRLDSIP